jgi:hypothetical protein|tara:strand:+ start:4018 stop:5634 length:1617 start_codon:yes stop_codon:yes gene_type:complete
MPGGLLNIISVGSANLILTGNPSKTFFKATYSKYTNFGLQKFRLDFDGLRELRLTEPSKYTFKMKRYGDLLMDTYVVINLPDIWSPMWMPNNDTGGVWSPYDFKWIENLGAQIIQEIEITCGSTTLQKYSGQYINAMVKRDFDTNKKNLFDTMSGNVPELNDPANNPRRTKTSPFMEHTYPTAQYTTNQSGAEPSIRGRTLYIPLNSWFTLDSRCAFPLIALQYQELVINVTLRPIQDLFQVRDVLNPTDNFPYIKIRPGENQFQMYRFLQTPPSIDISSTNYTNKTSTWDTDVHLLSTYAFLSEEEQALFAAEDQVYLVKEIYEYDFLNQVGSNRVKLQATTGMVANWMWYFQRNDAFLRNEWSNYTNWAYNNKIPSNIVQDPSSGLFISGDYSSANQYSILETLGILFGGDYREISMPRGVYDYVEKYTQTQGFAEEGLYCYNFCLNTNPREYQPSGAVNVGRFKTVELEFNTYKPPIDIDGSTVDVECDVNGELLTISRKPAWALYVYNYNLHVFEERYNVLSFVGGNCGLMYAR